MKRMKKVLAMLLAFTMVLGLSMTAMAETTTETTTKVLIGEPTETDAVTATVQNVVDDDAVVTAYQIVKAKYDTDGEGFLAYEKALPSLDIGDVEAPTSAEVTVIANKISQAIKNNQDTRLTSELMSLNQYGDYTAALNAGYWIILVSNTVEVYNPMLIGVYYSANDDGNTIEGGIVDADAQWTLETQNAYAKSSGTKLTKNSEKTTYNLGDVVKYTVTAKVPDYSAAYDAAAEVEEITFKIVDTVATGELEIDTNLENFQVKVGEVEVAQENYTLNFTETGYTIAFKDAWITANKTNTVTIIYNATLIGEYYANDTAGDANTSHDNTAVLTYTNALGSIKDDTVYESVYTFKVEDVITKTGEGEDASALDGAEFTIYTDEACGEDDIYRNSIHTDGTVISGQKPDNVEDDTPVTPGAINFYGLDVGEYYIRETKAPTGYSLNDEVFKITIEATANKDDDLEENGHRIQDTVADINVKITKLDGTEIGTIPNTKLLSLPSTGGIGTTIFTVAGCVIMIAAAALFFANRRREAR